MNKQQNFLQRYWRLILLATGIAVLAYFLLFRQLGGLTHAYSSPELASQAQASSLRTIVTNPVNAPYSLLVWIGLRLGHHSLLITRIAAAVVAIGMAVLFYWVALHWYSKRVALVSSVLFVSSSSFLHIGRYGTALILQMATLVLIATVLLHRRAQNETLTAYIIVAILALCLYVPGIFWFELLGLVLLHRHIWRLFRRLGRLHSTLIVLLGLGLVVPIVLAGSQHLSVFQQVLALPEHLPTIRTVWQHARQLGEAIVYRGYYSPDFWLFGAPLLNIAEIVLFLTGIFVVARPPHLRGNYYLAGAVLLSVILNLLGGNATIVMLIPLIYLVVAAGIYYLLDQWMTIFPRNPIAQALGVGLICIVASFSVYYHIQAYYIAWPQAPETKQVYTIKS